ncbi:MAG: hypothetical protein ACLUFF_01375 [Acutalibacteraceae bacterium]
MQRDILPIVGSTVTYYARENDHVLFIAAGAFHVAKWRLIPELQGRFHSRDAGFFDVEDFKRILVEPKRADKQYAALIGTEGKACVYRGRRGRPRLPMRPTKMQKTWRQTLHGIWAHRKRFPEADSMQGEVVIDRAYVNARPNTIWFGGAEEIYL